MLFRSRGGARSSRIVGLVTETVGVAPGQPPEWDLERFMRGDAIDTAVITLERNRRTFAWKCADVDADALRLRVGVSPVTLGGLLKHLAWVEEPYFQTRLAGRESIAPFDQLDLASDWDDWPWSTATSETPDALRALWVKSVHRSRGALAEALSRGGARADDPRRDEPAPVAGRPDRGVRPPHRAR